MEYFEIVVGWIIANATFPAALVFLAYFFRDLWIEKFKSRFLQNQNEEIEELRSRLSKQENISNDLRGTFLSGLREKRSIAVQKEFEAIDTVWRAVVALNGTLLFVSMFDRIDFDKAADLAEGDLSVRDFVKTVSGGESKDTILERLAEINAEATRPYVPLKIWALYSAYSLIIMNSFIKAKVIEFGAPKDILNDESHLKAAILEALPHQKKIFDEFDRVSYSLFLDTIRESIILEIRGYLEGSSQTSADLEAATRLIAEVERAKFT